MKHIIRTTALCLIFSTSLKAQEIVNVLNLETQEEYENISIKQLSSDSLVSTYVIWIKQNVRLHIHEYHTEHVYIIEGEGQMRLNGEDRKVGPGDFIHLPAKTPHGVEILSDSPMKVISIQSPEFLGKDRVFLED